MGCGEGEVKRVGGRERNGMGEKVGYDYFGPYVHN